MTQKINYTDVTSRVLKLCGNERSKSWKSATLQNFNIKTSADEF